MQECQECRPLAIITGGTSGIGLATARRLLESHQLALIYARDHQRARAVEDELRQLGGQVRCVSMDLRLDEAVSKGYSGLVEGQVPEVLVHCAGTSISAETGSNRYFLQGLDLDLCQRVMNLNFFGAVRLLQQALPSMYARRRGNVILLSSLAALGGYKGMVGYAESKAALECLVRNLAMEVGHRGLAVNALAPGLAETALTRGHAERFASRDLNAPLGRWIRPEEVAEAVAFLLAMGPVINGQCLVIDGGGSTLRSQVSW